MKRFFYFFALAVAVSFTACDLKLSNKETEEESAKESQVANEETVPEQQLPPHQEEQQGQVGVDEEQAASIREMQEFEQRFIAKMDESMVSYMEEGMTYTGTVVEDHKFICSISINEEIFGGLTMKTAFEHAGMTEKTFAGMMKGGMLTDMTEEEKELIKKLDTYQYDVVFRLKANHSGEEMNCEIEHQEFAI